MKLKYTFLVGLLVLLPILTTAQEATTTSAEVVNTSATSTEEEAPEGSASTIVPEVDEDTKIRSISQISENLIDIDQAAMRTESELRSEIKVGIDQAIIEIRAQNDMQAYLLQRAADDARTNAFELIRNEIRLNIPTNVEVVNNLSEELLVYISDIEASLEAVSDVVIDMTDLKEQTAQTMSEFAAQIALREEALVEVGADLLNQDTDEDGLSDYDETYVFNTDPNNANTAGGDLNDSEKVSRGINPTSPTSDPINYEDPRERDDAPRSRIYNVNRVELVDEKGEVISSTTQSAQKRLRISGTGLPNSYLTVYIFSTPIIVTVRTDSRGEWTYTLDRELENGEHEVHVATVDNSGKILAKSDAIPFTQTAEAAAIGAFVGIGDEPESGTGNFVQDNFVLVVIVIVLIGILITISLFGKSSENAMAGAGANAGAKPVKKDSKATTATTKKVAKNPTDEPKK